MNGLFIFSGPITKWEFDNTWGTVLVSPEKRKLVWSLGLLKKSSITNQYYWHLYRPFGLNVFQGQKFPKMLKISMNATVLLASPATATERSNFKEDPFCHGLNTYIQVLMIL